MTTHGINIEEYQPEQPSRNSNFQNTQYKAGLNIRPNTPIENEEPRFISAIRTEQVPINYSSPPIEAQVNTRRVSDYEKQFEDLNLTDKIKLHNRQVNQKLP